MKKLVNVSIMFFAMALFVVSQLFTGCNLGSPKTEKQQNDSVFVDEMATDSTIYGTCGEGTAMHTLELITDSGDTLQYIIEEEPNGSQVVQGGLLVGDRMAVIEKKGVDGERVAQKVLNLTTLLGKWVSLDKNFEIIEGGVVKSNVKAETNPWTNWKIRNGELILNNDTFEVNKLGKDSLYLENKNGIFTYKRP